MNKLIEDGIILENYKNNWKISKVDKDYIERQIIIAEVFVKSIKESVEFYILNGGK